MTCAPNMDAQADLSLRWAMMSFCWFCHAVAYMVKLELQIQMELYINLKDFNENSNYG